MNTKTYIYHNKKANFAIVYIISYKDKAGNV